MAAARLCDVPRNDGFVFAFGLLRTAAGWPDLVAATGWTSGSAFRGVALCQLVLRRTGRFLRRSDRRSALGEARGGPVAIRAGDVLVGMDRGPPLGHVRAAVTSFS